MKHLIEKGIQMANTYRKRYSVSLATKAMQSKTMKYQNILVRTVNFKTGDNSGKDVEKIDIIGVDTKWFSSSENYLAVCFFLFKTGSHYVNPGLLQLVVFLPQTLKY